MNDSLPHEMTPPSRLKARVMGSLERRGLLRPRARPWLHAARAAVVLLVFAGGVIAGLRFRVADQLEQGSRFLLLLYEDESFRTDQPTEALVQEYGAWAAALRVEGRMAIAEQLGSTGWLLGDVQVPAQPRSGPWGEVTGFFVIVADDRDAALDIARTCPHLRYGGRIAVRPIVGT